MLCCPQRPTPVKNENFNNYSPESAQFCSNCVFLRKMGGKCTQTMYFWVFKKKKKINKWFSDQWTQLFRNYTRRQLNYFLLLLLFSGHRRKGLYYNFFWCYWSFHLSSSSDSNDVNEHDTGLSWVFYFICTTNHPIVAQYLHYYPKGYKTCCQQLALLLKLNYFTFEIPAFNKKSHSHMIERAIKEKQCPVWCCIICRSKQKHLR